MKLNIETEKFRTHTDKLTSAGSGCRVTLVDYDVEVTCSKHDTYTMNKDVVMSVIHNMNASRQYTKADVSNYKYLIDTLARYAKCLSSLLIDLENNPYYMHSVKMGTPISDIDFSARTIKALERAGIENLQQLTILTADEVSKMKGIGSDRLHEIQNVLFANELSLRDGNEEIYYDEY